MRLLIDWIPRILAVLCALAVLPWLLGVPGVDNSYARGWSIGLQAILLYILVYCLIAGLGFVAARGWLAVPRRWIAGAHWIAVAGFVAAQAIAWPLILGS